MICGVDFAGPQGRFEIFVEVKKSEMSGITDGMRGMHGMLGSCRSFKWWHAASCAIGYFCPASLSQALEQAWSQLSVLHQVRIIVIS